MYEEDEEFGLHARRFEGIAWRVGEGSWELGSEVRGEEFFVEVDAGDVEGVG